MILLENNLIKIEFDKTVPCVVWTPLEYAVGEDFRKPLESGVDFFVQKIKEQPKMGWISDTTKCKAMKPDDVLWVVQTLNPIYSKAGGKKVAFILPEDPFAKIAIRLYIQYTRKIEKTGFEIKVFKIINDARLWIKGSTSHRIEEVKM